MGEDLSERHRSGASLHLSLRFSLCIQSKFVSPRHLQREEKLNVWLLPDGGGQRSWWVCSNEVTCSVTPQEQKLWRNVKSFVPAVLVQVLHGFLSGSADTFCYVFAASFLLSHSSAFHRRVELWLALAVCWFGSVCVHT